MADEQKIFDAVIKAKDESTSVIDGIEKHYHSLGVQVEHVAGAIDHAGKSMEHAGVQMEHLGQHMENVERHVHHLHEGHREAFEGMGEHADKLKEHYGELHESFAGFSESVFEFIPALSALGAATTVAGVFEAVAQTAEAYGALSHSAAAIGTSADALNVLYVVARLTDTSVEALDNSLTKMNRSLGEAAAGKNKQLAANLASIHFDPRTYKDPTEGLLQLADAFQHASNKKREMMAVDLFGRGGADLIPLLSLGRKGLEEKIAEARPTTISFKPYAEGLESYNESQKKLHSSVEGFVSLLGGKLAPAIDPLIKKTEKYVEAHREGITDDIAKGVKHVSDTIVQADWDDIGRRIGVAATSAEYLADALGGVDRIVEVLAASMALRTLIFLAQPIAQTFVFAGRVTSIAAQLTGELAGAWRAVGTAATEAAAEEMAAINAAAPTGSAVDVATNRARNLAARDAAAAAQSRLLNAQAAGLGLNLAFLAYGAQSGTSIDKDDVRSHPFLADKMTRAQFDALPDHIAHPIPMLGITGDPSNPGWLERVAHRDGSAPWYSPSRWIGIDGPRDRNNDASLHFLPASPNGGLAPLPAPSTDAMTPLPTSSFGSGPQRIVVEQKGGASEITLHIPNLPSGTTVETAKFGEGPNVLMDLGQAWNPF